jgi:hypothetical protein
MFYFAVGGLVEAAMWILWPLFRREILHGDLSDHGYWSLVLYELVVPGLWLATFLVLLLGAKRTGRTLAVLAFIGTVITAIRQRDTPETAIVATITVLAVLASFVRTAPPVKGRRWWFGALGLIGAAIYIMSARPIEPGRTTSLVEIAVTAAVLAATARVQKSPAWPLGLSVLGLPFLANWDVAGGFNMIKYGWGYFSGHPFRPAIVIELLFIATATFSITRQLAAAWRSDRISRSASEPDPPTAA